MTQSARPDLEISSDASCVRQHVGATESSMLTVDRITGRATDNGSDLFALCGGCYRVAWLRVIEAGSLLSAACRATVMCTSEGLMLV